jgi:hypothetical protein
VRDRRVSVRLRRGRGGLHFGVSMDLRLGRRAAWVAALAWRLWLVNSMHCLETLGDLARVHAAPADSVLVGECFSEDGIWTHGIVPWEWEWNLVVWVAVPACDALNNGGGQR